MVKSTTIAVLLASAFAFAPAFAAAPAFSQVDFKKLSFLQGRWEGTGPDGKAFFEQYDFADANTFRSRRYADASFATPIDGSSAILKDSEVIARWGKFSWTATELSAAKACFAPLEAPSSYCWQQVDPATVEVTQRWTDGAGKAQSMKLLLKRLPSGK